MPAQFEDFKPQFDKLIIDSEKFAVAAEKVSERLTGLNDRMTRMENVQQDLIADCKEMANSVHRRDSCPYHLEIERLKSDAMDAKEAGLTAMAKTSDFLEKGHAILAGTVSKIEVKVDRLGVDTIETKTQVESTKNKLAEFIEKEHSDLVSSVNKISGKLTVVGAMALAAMGGTVYAIVDMLLRHVVK